MAIPWTACPPIILHPADYQELLLAHLGSAALYTEAPDGVPRFAGLPVVVHTDAPRVSSLALATVYGEPNAEAEE